MTGQGVSESRRGARGRGRRWGALAVLLFGLTLLPLWALWGAGEEAPLDFRPSLWVAWSGRGGMPALAVTGFSPEAPREAWVLLPGEDGGGTFLEKGLTRSGVETLSEFLMPPGAAFSRSGERLGHKLVIRRLTLCQAPRGKTSGEDLARSLAREGSALQRCVPQGRKEEGGGHCWAGTLGEGNFFLERIAADHWQGEWQGREGHPRLRFRYPATGVLEVTWNGEQILHLPQIMPGGWRRVPLP